ncbi:class I SAM-dependent methyltransferase [Aestuariibaculum sp. M13]|uniref:class I SAM-dependent methyltransferase n=1 Tax=Aestuariibaculum sp. M13 TaxID=2967132 RepID=UPI00215A0C45|nr:class I SAM-dependent methyltransferase [Aestuariibaculum sp. M13]
MLCKVCEKEMIPKILFKGKEDSGDIYRCLQCKVAFVFPQPSDEILNKYYNGMYSDLTISFDERKMKWARSSMLGYLKELKNIDIDLTSNTTFLDLGGGLGYYTKAAEENNLDSILVEKDPVSIVFAKKHLQLKNIIEMDLLEFFKTNKKQYDIVFFRHVIEHVKDPSLIVENLYGVLKQNGVLIIETDNNAGIELLFKDGVRKFYLDLYRKSFSSVSFVKLLIKRPFAIDPPRHLFAFRINNLSGLLKAHGLIPKKRVHYRLGHPIYWPNIPSPSFKKLVKSFLKLEIRKFLCLFKSYMNLIFRRFLQFVGLSSGICIYAKKV